MTYWLLDQDLMSCQFNSILFPGSNLPTIYILCFIRLHVSSLSTYLLLLVVAVIAVAVTVVAVSVSAVVVVVVVVA
jgi:hypothetical protein